MKEQNYQSKIIKAIENIGGVVVNGTYSKEGIADLICGYPIDGIALYKPKTDKGIGAMLAHLHVEVKSKEAYKSLMCNHIKEVDGLYVVNKEFKGREKLQAHKLNEVRKRGGLALFAYSFEQVEAYINETL